jgi:hypothetical protein
LSLSFVFTYLDSYVLRIREWLPGAIGGAVQHVNEIASRPHLKAGTYETRVQLFLTSLRRNCIYRYSGIPNSVIRELACIYQYPGVWSDAGVLAPKADLYLNNSIIPLVRESVVAAAIYYGSDEGPDSAEKIMRDLQDLKNGLPVLDQLIVQAGHLNKLGDDVVNRWVDLLEKAA